MERGGSRGGRGGPAKDNGNRGGRGGPAKDIGSRGGGMSSVNNNNNNNNNNQNENQQPNFIAPKKVLGAPKGLDMGDIISQIPNGM